MDVYYFYDDNNEEQGITGEDYHTLIETCCKYSAYVAFRFWKDEPQPNGYTELSAFEIPTPKTIDKKYLPYLSYCGLPGIENAITYYKFYRVCPELCKLMQTLADDTEAWSYYDRQNPEDLFFYRADGSLFFQAIVHDGEYALFPREGEDVLQILGVGIWDTGDRWVSFDQMVKNFDNDPQVPAKNETSQIDQVYIDTDAKRDVTGEDYRTLIKTCCKYSAYLMLDFRTTDEVSPHFELLDGFEIPIPADLPAFYADKTWEEHGLCRKFYRICPELCDLLQTLADSLRAWTYEGIFFFREDGSTIFQALTKDKNTLMNLREDEDFSKVLALGKWTLLDDLADQFSADIKATSQSFYGADTTLHSRSDYAGDSDLVGNEYRLLLETCCKYSTYLMLEYDPDEQVPERFKALDAFEIPMPSCLSQKCAKNAKFYRVCPELIECMLSVTDSAFEWTSYQDADQKDYFNPSDPTFFREDGTVFLYDCAHEFLCVLSHRENEDVSAIIANPKWTAGGDFFDW